VQLLVLSLQPSGPALTAPRALPRSPCRDPAAAAQVVDGRGPEVRTAASEFCRFLFTPPAQREFAKLGFRVNLRTCKEVAAQQTGLPPATLWTVSGARALCQQLRTAARTPLVSQGL
jgi:hypothetical protein